MAIKQKKPEPVVFDNPEDLLIAMLRGRRFEYEGKVYYYNIEAPYEFRWSKQWDDGETGGDWGVAITDTMVHTLVGNKLKEADPLHIEVDTLLYVLNCPIVEGSTSITPQLNYFSHWSEGKLYCFAEGTTSLTATKTIGWRYWEFAKEAK